MATHDSTQLPILAQHVKVHEKEEGSTAFGSALAKGGFEHGLDYVLNIIKSPSLSQAQAADVMADTIQNWGDHVNPAFLKYRKSVADDFAAIEWADGKPGGSTLIDANGREYIDCLGGFGIYNCGHSHPAIVGAVQAQMSKASLNTQELLDPLRAYCAALVARVLPGDLKYCFFTNSGTESVEHSLKFAMLSTGRRHFVALLGGFHGKTLGSLSATSKACFRGAFGGGLLPISHIPVNDLDALRRVFESSKFTGNEIAGLILEPVLGEGGIHILTNEYMQLARKLCDDYGARLIFDEVQSGMGRTGKWWACEHAGVSPDIMAVGKAFGGGVMPAGMVCGNAKSWSKYLEEPFLFTTTFGGNPLAMAAAISTLATIEKEGLVQQAAEKGDYLMGELRKLQAAFPGILRQVRGRGLLIGLEFPDDDIGYTFSRGAFGRQVLLAGTLINSRVIRVEPPLTITYEEMDEVIARFRATFEAMVEAEPRLREAPTGPVTLAIPGVPLASAASTTAGSSKQHHKTSSSEHVHSSKAAAATAAGMVVPASAAAAVATAHAEEEEHEDLRKLKVHTAAASGLPDHERERSDSVDSDTTGTEITGGTSVNHEEEERSLSPSSLSGQDEEDDDEEDEEEDEEDKEEAEIQKRLLSFAASQRELLNALKPAASTSALTTPDKKADVEVTVSAAKAAAAAVSGDEGDKFDLVKKVEAISLLALTMPSSNTAGAAAGGLIDAGAEAGSEDDEPSAEVPSFQPIKGRRRKALAAAAANTNAAAASPTAAGADIMA